MTGMPSIIASVARSRRIWMNSFQMMERRRWTVMGGLRGGMSHEVSYLVLLLDGDEDVLQAHSGAEARLHLGRRSDCLELAAREEREPVELLGLVPVMVGDDHRRSLVRQPSDDVPEP